MAPFPAALKPRPPAKPGSGLLHTVTKAAAGSDPALVATRTWDTTRDVLLAIGNKAGGTVRSSYTSTVNAIGQRTAVTTGGSEFTGSPADWSWRYDALGQLEKAALCTTGDNGRNSGKIRQGEQNIQRGIRRNYAPTFRMFKT